MVCTNCGSDKVEVKVFQENTSSKTITKTKTKSKTGGHGLLWWLCGGLIFAAIDFFLWVILFVPRLCLKLVTGIKTKSKSKSKSNTVNKFGYVTMYVCQNCGKTWKSGMLDKLEKGPLSVIKSMVAKD